jgi:hypothetical protein
MIKSLFDKNRDKEKEVAKRLLWNSLSSIELTAYESIIECINEYDAEKLSELLTKHKDCNFPLKNTINETKYIVYDPIKATIENSNKNPEKSIQMLDVLIRHNAYKHNKDIGYAICQQSQEFKNDLAFLAIKMRKVHVFGLLMDEKNAVSLIKQDKILTKKIYEATLRNKERKEKRKQTKTLKIVK